MTGNDKLIKKSITTPSIAAFQFLYYLAPRLLNRVGIVSDRLVNIFADFATELVLVQKLAHGLLGTGPNHATRTRNCKERGGHGDL